jgi:hypothetical protein
MEHHRPMRWYNPKLEYFEWRGIPESDEVALRLLHGCPDGESYTAVYHEWRELGASIHVALIRAGEATEVREGKTSP